MRNAPYKGWVGGMSIESEREEEYNWERRIYRYTYN